MLLLELPWRLASARQALGAPAPGRAYSHSRLQPWALPASQCQVVAVGVPLLAAAAALAAGGRRRSRHHPRGPCSRTAATRVANGAAADKAFPWSFTGRVRFRPALVQAPERAVADGVQALSLFGITLGGSVCLQYDTSPVGPYLEVVQMAAAVFSERLCTAALWGCRLMVSTDEADSANGDNWGVPSERRDIAFDESGDPGVFTDAAGRLRVGDWGVMRFAGENVEPWGRLPIWWTPTLKALWLPFSLWRDERQGGSLPLRRLRLSAAALRLRWAPAGEGGDAFTGGLDAEGDEALRWPLPMVVEADGVVIEIGEVFDQL